MMGWQGVDLEDENGAIINNTQQVRAFSLMGLGLNAPSALIVVVKLNGELADRRQ